MTNQSSLLQKNLELNNKPYIKLPKMLCYCWWNVHNFGQEGRGIKNLLAQYKFTSPLCTCWTSILESTNYRVAKILACLWFPYVLVYPYWLIDLFCFSLKEKSNLRGKNPIHVDSGKKYKAGFCPFSDLN